MHMQNDEGAGTSLGELNVPESEIKNLQILTKADLIFAILYGFLFLWGLILTLLAI